MNLAVRNRFIYLPPIFFSPPPFLLLMPLLALQLSTALGFLKLNDNFRSGIFKRSNELWDLAVERRFLGLLQYS